MRDFYKAPQFTQYSRILFGDERIHENILVNEPITGPPCGTVTTMWENLKRTTAIHPDADFLGEIGNDGRYHFKTYKEVMEIAETIGSAVYNLGIQTGTRVGLAGIHSVNYEEAMWGLISQGIALVPLYHNSKDDAICEIVASCQLELIFCDTPERIVDFIQKRKEGLIESVKILVLLNGNLSEISTVEDLKILVFADFLKLGEENRVKPNPPKADDVYIICHTSGTTGRPKGVQLTHKNLLAAMSGLYMQWCHPPHDFKFGTNDTYFSFLSLAHIYEHLMQSFIIYTGGRVGVYSGDLKKLILDIQNLKPTMISLVPRILNKLYDQQLHRGINNPNTIWDKLVFEKIRLVIGGRVRYLTTGGAPVTPAVHDFTRIAFGCPLFEGYGQTECGAAGTLNLPGDLTGGTHVGAPAPWAQIKLVDVPELGYLSANDKGEVCFRGAAVMKGYFGDEELSKKTVDEQGWLHTGDIGEWLPDGRLKIIDRKNALFKLAQGDFVSAEAIESILGLSPLVNQIFVTGLSTRSFLVGIVVVEVETLKKEIEKNGDSETKACLSADGEEFLCKEPIKRFMTQYLSGFGKSKGLQTIETLRRVYLTFEELTAESGLLTPTLKIRRQPCREKFMAEIDAMYDEETEL
ncbi:unnamed protein product, partial [Mesorhabditis belari]|uniref:long-chain-fatty-acid--CoA ligase n=1 Tax=Mesorhabditis belari TaxID=2138241 RepID=A0AAF3F1L3_9BILA